MYFSADKREALTDFLNENGYIHDSLITKFEYDVAGDKIHIELFNDYCQQGCNINFEKVAFFLSNQNEESKDLVVEHSVFGLCVIDDANIVKSCVGNSEYVTNITPNRICLYLELVIGLNIYIVCDGVEFTE